MSEHWRQEERLFLHLGNERNTGGSGRRYFSRGGVKYALLELLAHEDMHGYQMMKALEEQSGGTYKPSAGSIYPTLQMLRDQGFVESYKQDGKRIFQITPEGRLYLQEEMERPEQEREREPDPEAEQYPEQEEQSGAEAGDKITYSGGPNLEPMERGSPEEGDARPEGVRRNRRLTPRGKELIHLLKAAERSALADATKAARLRAVLEELRHSLRLIVGDAAASLGGADAGDGGGAATAGAHGQEAREAEVRGAEVREAEARETEVRGAEVREAEAREAEIRGAEVREAEVREAEAREAEAREAAAREAEAREAAAREAEAREAAAREAGPRHRGLRHRGLRRGGPRGGGPRHGRPRRGGRG